MAFNQFVINLAFTQKPQLTVDELEKVQFKPHASLVGHVFQLTYAAIFDFLIQKEKVNSCCGCAIHHPCKRQHTCVMDSQDGWFYYHDNVREKIDLSEVLKTAESVCGALGFKLDKTWEAYVAELPKFPWTSIYVTSLELGSVDKIVQPKELQERILYALYYGPCGLKCKEVGATEVMNVEVKCPENVVRKEEEPMDID